MSEHYAPRREDRAEPDQLGAVPRTPRERLLSAQLDARNYFVNQLDSSWGPRYLLTRGFTQGTARSWAIGYAPPTGTALREHLLGLGYSVDELLDAGLVTVTRDRRVIDRFRDRIMIPIHDHGGTVVAFFGRSSATASKTTPKVLNSPNSDIFTKSQVLFGLHRGLARLAAGAQPVLVEGPWDALAINMDPRFVGLATCGTTLSDKHVELLMSLAPVRDLGIITAFDPDEAGLKASLKAWGKLTLVTDDTYAIQLPSGTDPADLLRLHGRERLAEAFGQPQPLSDLVVDAVLGRLIHREDGFRPLDHWYTRYTVLRQITDVLRGKPVADVQRQMHRIASRLSLPVSEVMTAFVDNCGDVAAASANLPMRPSRLLGSGADRSSSPRSRPVPVQAVDLVER